MIKKKWISSGSLEILSTRNGEKSLRPQKKKCIAFKATPCILEKDEETDEGDEDEYAMVVRKVGTMFYKQGKMSNYRSLM